ncbi:MAG: hypothetical protein J7L86_01260 [Candidatus Marinimicrobia bacterium]|nr:hypothetical protein [Candidatus Neomarinimicrobiota bacterium]
MVMKHAPTPIKSAVPRLPYPRQRENISDPNASIVAREVSKMAFPVSLIGG